MGKNRSAAWKKIMCKKDQLWEKNIGRVKKTGEISGKRKNIVRKKL
jgi:hypothetical protein